MALVRYDPFRELQDRMNRMFGDVRRDDDWSHGEWLPAVDVYENDQHELVIKAEMPGMHREDIDVKIENNTLTIRGERKREHEVRAEQYHRVERGYGSFARSFALPAAFDADKVSADYADGILSVVLPKRDEAKPRQISVSVH